MSEVYWENLYQKGDTQWDKGAPSPGLVDFLNSRASLKKGSVLVPGCGMGHDVRAWAKAGFHATGLDIAPTAVEQSRRQTEGMLPATFRQGDFLHDAPFAPFDYVFEHTLFCAIQPEERPEYVKALLRWLRPGGMYVAIFYLIPDTEGPPFGSTREGIREVFEKSFRLTEEWVPRSYPNRTGLEWMTIWSEAPKPER